jgi:hypothetical protein
MDNRETVKRLVEAGYSCNPYTGAWMKIRGNKTLSIRTMPNEVTLTPRMDGERFETCLYDTLEGAIAAGEKWLEGGK